MRIFKVSKTEFELEDGRVFPIIPPLEKDMSIEEFQQHYDYAAKVVRGFEETGCDNTDSKGLG
jgi:hypothetical protein